MGSENKVNNETLEFRITKGDIAFVVNEIGQIQIETATRIEFKPDQQCDQFNVCTVTGPEMSVQKAEMMIKHFVLTNKNRELPKWNSTESDRNVLRKLYKERIAELEDLSG